MRIRDKLNNERGSMLIFTLLIFIVLAVLGLSLMTVAANTLKNTKNERDDQAVYYIAEAGLVQKRAAIYDQIGNIYTQLQAEYDRIEEPILKSKFDFDQQFFARVRQIPVNEELHNTVAYEDHFDQSAYSQVMVKKVEDNAAIHFIITAVGNIGDARRRTLTQSVNISLDKAKSTKQVPVSDGKPATRLNSCYAVMSNGAIASEGGGRFNGNIYSASDIRMTASPVINGKIYSKGNVTISGTPKELKGVFSEKDITISGGSTIDGYVAAGGNVLVSNGTVRKDILSNKNIVIANWPNIYGEMIANQNITVEGGNFGNSGGLRAIAKNNIKVTSWIKPNKAIYAGVLETRVNYNKPKPVSAADIDTLFEQYRQNLLHAAGYDLFPALGKQHECDASFPQLKPANEVFGLAAVKPAAYDETIVPPASYTGEYEVHRNGNLHIDEINLFPDTNYRIRQLSISLNENSVLDVSRATLQSKSSLTLKLQNNNTVFIDDLKANPGSQFIIDLNGGHHKIYVDSMVFAGNLNLLNAGKADIIVRNKLNLVNSRMNQEGNVKDLSIYYAGSPKFTLEGQSHVNGELHVMDADVTITASGHIYGDVLVYGSNRVAVEGGASAAQQVFWAPNSEFVLSGGATINGNIVAKQFKSSGGFTINAPKPGDIVGGEGIVMLPIDVYGDKEQLFEQGPQLEK